jgi:hypothetical protein
VFNGKLSPKLPLFQKYASPYGQPWSFKTPQKSLNSHIHNLSNNVLFPLMAVQVNQKLRLLFLIPLLLLIQLPETHAQFYQGYQMTFGKNRVQYNDFFWTFYRFKNFDTYFYVGGQELAVFVGKTADKEINDVEKLFDFKSNSRLQFMIFNKLSDLKQTNIGLEGDEMSGNTGGLTRVMGTKVLVYFDGNHEHLRQQIRAGVAQVIFNQLLYGGNIKDRLQSAVLLTIPSWYEKGLISYVAKGWGVEEDNQMRDGIISGKYKKFNRLLESESEFAGHSMWHYIAQNYGTSSIANLLYMTRINRSIESGFVYVLGVNLKKLTQNWMSYNQKYYQNEENGRTLPVGDAAVKKNKTGRVFTELTLSHDGTYLAYVTNDLGKYKVYLKNLRENKTKRILKDSYKSLQQKPDFSFPQLAFHPSGQFLTVIREKRGKIWMDYYKPGKRKPETAKFFYFDKVLDFSYADNGQEIVLSGVQQGQSDIFVYNVRSRTSQNITNDFYDDLEPAFIDESRKIVFASNRVNDTLNVDRNDVLPPNNNLDLYSYDYRGNNPVLTRVTNTPLANESHPLAADSGRFYFLSDENGIYNRYVGTIDSTISFIDTVEHYRYFVKTIPQTNYSRNIEEHTMSFRKNFYGEMVFSNGKYRIFVNRAPQSGLETGMIPPATQWRQSTALNYNNQNTEQEVRPKKFVQVPDTSSDAEVTKQPADSSKIDIDNYVFQSEFGKPPKKKEKTQPSEVKPEKAEPLVPIGKSAFEINPDTFLLPKQRNYDVAFSADYFVTQLDNSLQNSTYQTFTGSAFYFDPGLNVLFKVGIADLMNDYKITGGFRLSGDLNSNEYFASFDYLKKRLDKSFMFFRQAREYVAGFSYLKVHTHELKGQLKFPFNDLASLRGSLSLRTDRIVTLSTDIASLQVPTQHDYWGSGKIEYVFDNTISTGLNLFNGFRYKVFVEAFRQIDRKETWLGVVGLDVRNYLKLHRQIIWANRFAASTSTGDEKLIYYLGSQDNAIVPTDIFDYSIPIDYSQNYRFQALATNMRGFLQNIRNGNSFAVINSELRIPVFQYLVNKPIRSDFIRNFQIVGFFDVGTAWTGDNPYSDDNTFNTEIIGGNPVTVILDRQIEPIVAGFGGGLRSRLFGYFLRADWAWGYEDSVIRDPIFYLSLGLDF